MKKLLFVVLALAFSASALADSIPAGSPDTGRNAKPKMSEADSQSPEAMRAYLAPADGAGPLYDTYLKNGYLPLHAMMLSNWDITEALRQVSPGIPENPHMKNQLQLLSQQYMPVQ